MTKKLIQLTSGSVLLLLTAICIADDTDVYLNVGAGLPAGSEPMIIFSLDYRPNLGSTVCNGSECDTLIAEGYMKTLRALWLASRIYRVKRNSRWLSLR